MADVIKKIGEVLTTLCCIGLVVFIIYSDFFVKMPYGFKFLVEGAIIVVMINLSYFTLPKDERGSRHRWITLIADIIILLAAMVYFAN